MKWTYSLREMFFLFAVAALATGWFMDRYRMQSVIKKDEQIEQLTRKQLESVTDCYKMQQEEINALWKLIPEEKIRSVIEPIQDKPDEEKVSGTDSQ